MGDAGRRERGSAARWLLLVHQLPARPAYLRVKVWRRLQALGAVIVRNSVYLLPASAQAEEDFGWLLKEMVEGGGEGMVCEARLVDGLSDHDVRSMFNAARDADYAALAKDALGLAEMLATDASASGRAEARGKLARLRVDAARAVAIDFFGADGRDGLEGLLATLEARMRERQPAPRGDSPPVGGAVWKGRVWVTRAGVHVDRIASAWLIQRFIDPEAQFKFVAAKGYAPEAGEARFDMVEAEFTHEGDRCTFEALLAAAGLADPALHAIGEIVHDIDLKDGKFGREETSGIAHLVEGIAASHGADEARISHGGALLDALHAYFRSKRA